MRRYIQRGNATNNLKRINLVAILTLVAILSGLLLYFTNERQNKQVLRSYCGDLGFSGKSLVLMKDSTFRFSYYGCSQVGGYVKGKWNIEGNVLSFDPEIPDDQLGLEYIIDRTELIPITNSIDEKFTLCDFYLNLWERS